MTLPFFGFLQTETVFDVLKAHLKRAPSLKGAALVKLSQLKIQAQIWPTLRDTNQIGEMLDKVEIKSNDWFTNILNIYKMEKMVPRNLDIAITNSIQSV